MESRISGHTKLFCLIGSPVGHSGSPAMYNYSFQRTGIDAAYLAFNIPLAQTEAGVQALKTLGVGGFNITMPCKTAVAAYLPLGTDADGRQQLFCAACRKALRSGASTISEGSRSLAARQIAPASPSSLQA